MSKYNVRFRNEENYDDSEIQIDRHKLKNKYKKEKQRLNESKEVSNLINSDSSEIKRKTKILDDIIQPVIIKQFMDDTKGTYLRELEGLTDNKHESIVELLGHNEKKQKIYLKEISGITLNTLLKTCGKVEIENAVPLLYELAKPLVHVHSSNNKPGYVHYDISDNNYIISDNNKIKLIDFATSYKIDNIPEEYYDKSVGTPMFYSPEKLQFDPTKGQESDVFAFGVLMYKTISGIEPFNQALGNIERQILKSNPVPLNSGSKLIDNLVISCLEKNYSHRPKMYEIEKILGNLK